MDNNKAWDYAIGIVQDEDIRNVLCQKYRVKEERA